MAEQEEQVQKAVADPETYREALDGWMKRRMPEATAMRVHDVDMPRATGFSNETVFFSASWQEEGRPVTRRFVARIEPPDGGLFPVQAPGLEVSCALQHRIMQAVRDSGVVPMPELLPFEGDASVLGRPFFVMEFVEGRIPADVPRYSQAGFLVDEATPADRARMGESAVATLVALARLDWRELGLSWLDPSGRGEPTLRHQLDLYRRYVVKELAGREHPVLETSLDWLDRNAPEAPAGISWGDSRLGNIIWQDYRCASVCDWEAVALCPPEADIGWFVMFDRMSFDDLDAKRLEGFPTRAEQVALWESASGRKVADAIDYWEIFGAMRFDAIMIKLGDRMVRAGIVPADLNMPVVNGTTDSLARLLERQGVAIGG
ncbi:MAG: phosphotransferase family protein [Myxococcales bacterium]|nr:phosphotransferase family protein [Myxococcales bacterium]